MIALVFYINIFEIKFYRKIFFTAALVLNLTECYMRYFYITPKLRIEA